MSTLTILPQPSKSARRRKPKPPRPYRSNSDGLPSAIDPPVKGHTVATLVAKIIAKLEKSLEKEIAAGRIECFVGEDCQSHIRFLDPPARQGDKSLEPPPSSPVVVSHSLETPVGEAQHMISKAAGEICSRGQI